MLFWVVILYRGNCGSHPTFRVWSQVKAGCKMKEHKTWRHEWRSRSHAGEARGERQAFELPHQVSEIYWLTLVVSGSSWVCTSCWSHDVSSLACQNVGYTVNVYSCVANSSSFFCESSVPIRSETVWDKRGFVFMDSWIPEFMDSWIPLGLSFPLVASNFFSWLPGLAGAAQLWVPK